MPEHSGPDIIEQIDSLTEDAASWSVTGELTRPRWAIPEPGCMTAIELSMARGEVVDISDTDADRDITSRVGDPGIDRVRHLRRVQFWVGGNSAATSPINTSATRLLHQLLADVRDGHYIASDQERDHARALFETPETLPVIHGTCLVTGVGDGGGAAPLDENFQAWFTTVLDKIAQLREHIIAAIARVSGIPLEEIGHVVLVRLQ